MCGSSSTTSTRSRSGGRPGRTSAAGAGGRVAERELHGEGRAAALLGGEHDAPAVLAHDALADREAESGALALGLGGEEGLEHLRGERLGHARSVVDHVDGHAVQPAARADHHACRAGRCDAIAWAALLIRLTKTCWIWFGIDVGHRQVGLDLDLRLDPVRHELVAEQDEGGVEQRLERAWAGAGAPASARSSAGS